MPFRVRITEEAERQLGTLPTRDQRRLETAIETPLVEPTVVEQRPSRYLFSALRRKQQGLS